MLFYVQLKATGSEKKSEILNIDFKIETLYYFKQLEIPVLLARYSEHLDKFYIMWINDVDLTFAKENAKTFRININEEDEFTDKSSIQIENVLSNVRLLKSGSFKFPITYSINSESTEILGLSNNLLNIQLRNKLNDYSDFLEFKKSEENFLVQISINQNILLVQPSILKGVYFHNIDKDSKENFIENLSLDILLSLSMCMVMLGLVDYAGKIIFENNLEDRLIEKEELLLMILPALITSSYFKNTIDLIDTALDRTENEIILFHSIASLFLQSKTKNKSKIKHIESFFKSQLNKAIKLGIDGLIATSHYNLGNFYRSKDQHLKSINHYVSAKRKDSEYLKRPYYFREIAGVCFENEKYSFSSKFYEKAIIMGDKGNTKSLYADALMFSGNYEKANIIFSEYITETENPFEEFLLKSILLNRILVDKNIKSQKRNPTEANQLADIRDSKSNEEEFLGIEKAIEKDLLSGLAWFNLGILTKEKNDFIKASQYFAFSALINLGDIEAWTFAFLSFLNSGKESDLLVGSLILKTAYWHNRDEFLMHLYQILETNNKSNKNIIELIDNMLVSNIETDLREDVLRILGNDEIIEIGI
jgi:tetratricopeptide (TPR) repeat protein